jgi:hypothetical protein
MKKLVLVLSVAALAVSCKKVQAGGNQGVLRIEEGADRYDAHEARAPQLATVEVAPVAKDSTAVAPEAAPAQDSAQVQP